MAQNSAWVITGLGAFPPHLLFLSPKNLMCYKVLIFHSTLFSRRKWPETRIRFSESPFCCTSHLYPWEILHLSKISVFQGFFCPRKSTNTSTYLVTPWAFIPPSWSLLLLKNQFERSPTADFMQDLQRIIADKERQVLFKVRNQHDYNSLSLKQGASASPSLFLWMCCGALKTGVIVFAFIVYFLTRLTELLEVSQ